MIGPASAAIGWAFDPARRRVTILVLLAGLLVGSLLLASHWRQEAREARTVAKQTEAYRKADDAAVATAQRTREAIRQKEATGLEATYDALEAHPDWANEPVPDDVLRSLHE